MEPHSPVLKLVSRFFPLLFCCGVLLFACADGETPTKIVTCVAGVVACSDESPCASGDICTNGCCATSTGCAMDADCSNPRAPACDLSMHKCVACVDASNLHGVNAACPQSAPACENERCVACNPASSSSDGANGACASDAAVCAPSSTCVPCLMSADSKSGSNPACPASAPICNGGTACVECVNDAQCKGHVGTYCDRASNRCVAPTMKSFADATLGPGMTTSLGITLDHAVTATAGLDIPVALGANSVGTLGAARVHVDEGKTSGSVDYTAPAMSGEGLHDSVTATLGKQSLTSSITITATILPPTLESLLGPDGTNDAVHLATGQSVTLTLRLTESATTLAATVATSGAAASTTPTTINFANEEEQTFTLTAGGAAGPVTVTASYTPAGGALTTKSISVLIFKVNPTLSISTNLLPTSGTATLTVGLDAAPPVPVTVTLATAGPANLTQSLSSSSFAFAAGSTVPTGSATSVLTAGSSFVDGTGASTGDTTTIAASTPGGTSASTNVRISPTVTSVAFVDPIAGTPATAIAVDSKVGANVVVTLNTKAPVGGTTVFLSSAAAFNSHVKYKAYIPTSIVVPAGSLTQAVGGGDSAAYPTPFFACYNLSSGTDVATVFASLPGLPASGASQVITVNKQTTGIVTLCPTEPFDFRTPVLSPAVPQVMTVTFPLGTGTVDFATDSTPPAPSGNGIGTQYSCGTVQVGGVNVPTTGLSIANSGVFSAQVSYLPPATAPAGGTCYIRTYLRCTGVGTPTGCTAASGSWGSGTYVANNVQLARAKLSTPAALATTHLLLNKVEVDENGAPDVHEYVEIINSTAAAMSLTGYKLLLVANANSGGTVTGDNAGFYAKSEIYSVDLGLSTGMLSPNQRLVVADNSLATTLVAGSGSLQYVVAISDTQIADTNDGNLKNSPAAVVLVDATGNVVDSLAWGGAELDVTATDVMHGCYPGTGVGTVPCAFDLIGGGHPLDTFVLDQVGSTSATTCTYPITGPCFVNTFVRTRDGIDTGNQDLDWRLTTNAIAGTANTITGP